MPSFKVEVPHAHTAEEAAARVRKFMEFFRAKNADLIKNLEENWQGHDMHFSFRTLGMTISGVMHVVSVAVKVEGSLPFAAFAFKGKIEQSIREGLERALKA